MPHFVPRIASVALLLLGISAAGAAEPVVRRVTPPGLTIGQVTRLVIEGENLMPEPQLLLPLPLRSQKLIADHSNANRIELEIVLDETLVSDLVPAAIGTTDGLSAPWIFAVDLLPQHAADELGILGQDVELPAAVFGRVDGQQTVEFSLKASEGQSLWFEVEAQRIGSPLRPDLRVLDAEDRPIAWSGPRTDCDGDARLEVTFPADAMYRVQVRDVAYEAHQGAPFRLKVGHFPASPATLPVAVEREVQTSVVMRGAGLQDATRTVLLLTHSPWRRWMPLPDPTPLPASGPAPKVLVSNWREMLEPASDEPVRPPLGISGCIAEAGEVDRFRVAAQPGQQLRIGVLARTVGSRMDPELTVRSAGGEVLARSDDAGRSLDPGLKVQVPDGGEPLEIELRDVTGAGGPDYVYRLAVWPASVLPSALSFSADRVFVPAGGRTVVRLERPADEAGQSASVMGLGLPPGVFALPHAVASGEAAWLVAIEASEAGALDGGFVRWIVPGSGNAFTPVRIPGDRQLVGRPVSEVYGIPVWVGAKSPIQVDWSVAPDSLRLARGHKGTLPISLTVVAPEPSGQIRLSLVTSGPVAARGGGGNQEPPTVRLVEQTQLERRSQDVSLQVEVPKELQAERLAVAVVAELVEGDQVRARTATPIASVSLVGPLSIEVESVELLERNEWLVRGRVYRVPELDQPVVVRVEGAPGAVAVPSVRIPASVDRFQLLLDGQPYREAEANLKLVADVEKLGDTQGSGGPTRAEAPIRLPRR